MNEADTRKRLEDFERRCRAAGVRLTHQRRGIFREIASCDDHPDAETVFARVRARIPEISLDTVYRTLHLLRDLGLVTILSGSPERMRVDGNIRKHHHFVCTRCGLIEDFYCSDMDNLPIPKVARNYGRIESSQVELRGICHKCSKRSNP